MLDALACSIAQTAADTLGRRVAGVDGREIPDEAVALHLWHERGFRDHDTLVQLINHTRRILDERQPARTRVPVQLSFDLRAA